MATTMTKLSAYSLHAFPADGTTQYMAPIDWLSVPRAEQLSSFVITSEPATVPAAFLQSVPRLLAEDPRIASVCLIDSTLAGLAGEGPVMALLNASAATPVKMFGSGVAGSAIVIANTTRDLIGGPADSFGDLTVQSLTQWSKRANERGLRHLWWWSGQDDTSTPLVVLPDLEAIEALDAGSAIGLLVDRFRAAHRAISVAVEARWLGRQETGAQVATVNWLSRLSERPDIAEIRLYNLPDGQLPEYASHLMEQAAIRVVRSGQQVPPADIFWRPYQPDDWTDADTDRALGRRLVTTILDLIEYSNSRYQGGPDRWQERRNALRSYLSKVDFVTGISDDVLSHLKLEVPGLDPNRMGCTHLGVEHLEPGPAAPPEELVSRWPAAGTRRFLLCLGNDFVHKNRDFAIRVWQELATHTDLDLVLAGFHVAQSSTRDIEDVLLARASVEGPHAIRLSHVSSATRMWLMANATAVLYPTSAEGFGFIPHEAASLGVPTVFTSFGPLAETLPTGLGLGTWKIDEHRDRVLDLLDTPGKASSCVAAIRAQDAELNWDASAASLAGFFRAALASPPRDVPGPVTPTTNKTEILATLGVPPGLDPQDTLIAVTSSLSWRVTAPLRSASAAAKRQKRRIQAARRAAL